MQYVYFESHVCTLEVCLKVCTLCIDTHTTHMCTQCCKCVFPHMCNTVYTHIDMYTMCYKHTHYVCLKCDTLLNTCTLYINHLTHVSHLCLHYTSVSYRHIDIYSVLNTPHIVSHTIITIYVYMTYIV